MFLILQHLGGQQMIHHLFLLRFFRILLGNCINRFLRAKMRFEVRSLILLIHDVLLLLFSHLLHYVVLISLLVLLFVFILEFFKPSFRFDAVVESIFLFFSEFLKTANVLVEALACLLVHIAGNEMVLITFVH